ncbi:MAG: aldo/keto reductase [Bacteroidales bacterium]|nr:aldo/keto reductase [Bacteroidales bacterium]
MINPLYKAADDRYENKMQYRRAGKSGLLLPEISLGLWHNFGDTAPLERSRDILLAAFDNGVTHFDLANNYGPSYGSAESTFGQVFAKDLKPYRDEMVISTKAGYDMWPGPYGIGGSRKYLFASLDQSLKRMNLDYVDIFYSHRYDAQTPLEETMQALVDIVRSGKTLYAGISNYPHDKAIEAYNYLQSRDVRCVLHQGKYNMFVRTAETEGILDCTAEAGSGYIAFSPLAQGLLTDRYFKGIPEGSRASKDRTLKSASITREVVENLKKLDAIAQRRGQSLAQMALSWVLKDQRVTSVIVGASSVDQLKDNLKAAGHSCFSDEELSQIEDILKLF